MERLTASDLMAIWPERRGWSCDIAALAILDGADWLDAAGGLSVEPLRERSTLLAVDTVCSEARRIPVGHGWALRAGAS